MAANTMKYLGPYSHVILEDKGRVYHPGDDMPISKERALAMMRNGHVFEELTPKAGEPSTTFAPAPTANPWETSAPVGDNGAYMEGYVPGKNTPQSKEVVASQAPPVVPALPTPSTSNVMPA